MIAAPAAVSVELLRFAPQSPQTAVLFQALQRAAESAGVHVEASSTYRGGSDWLMVWGPGHPARFEPMRQQVARGGHVIAWDAAYWERHRKFRVSIDAAHPQAYVLRRNWASTRLREDGVVLRDRYHPDGPIIVAGLGAKARTQYGPDRIEAWERARIAEAAPCGRPILYRSKAPGAPVPLGTRAASTGPIDAVLDGVSAVITYHSNVAVDAIRLGIPVRCQDGAAAAVCLPTWPPARLPLVVRERFLANLAWFQWTPSEAADCWAFLRELLT